jgi:hypothetical protein
MNAHVSQIRQWVVLSARANQRKTTVKHAAVILSVLLATMALHILM